jgi:addiction module RelE/StbE family toxin
MVSLKKGKEKREVIFQLSSEFRQSYKDFVAIDPSIQSEMTEFNKNKRLIPPQPLPLKFKDHTLKGVLDGIRECHLAHDILLLYTHSNDIVRLLLVCDHRDMKGTRGQSLQRRLKPLK